MKHEQFSFTVYICMYWQTQCGYRFYLAGRPRAVGLACRWCPACCRAGRGRGWTSGHRSPQQGPSEQSHAPRLGHLEYLYSQTTKQQVSYLPQNRKSCIYHKTECPLSPITSVHFHLSSRFNGSNSQKIEKILKWTDRIEEIMLSSSTESPNIGLSIELHQYFNSWIQFTASYEC